MIEQKDIDNAKKLMEKCRRDGILVKSKEGEFEFFMKKSDQALKTAKVLLEISEKGDFESFVWVINTSYYSMFYGAIALLAFYGQRIKSEEAIHSLTYNALVHFFLGNDKKLEKHILENYKLAENETAQLLAQEKIEKVKLEKDKRSNFTYNMGVSAEKSKAKTSFDRAKEFSTLIKEMTLKK